MRGCLEGACWLFFNLDRGVGIEVAEVDGCH
jgi:hypothetical protein